MSESDAILSELRHMRAEQKALMAIIVPLVTRKQSVKAQAKAAGCSPSTLWRRNKAAQRKLKISQLF